MSARVLSACLLSLLLLAGPAAAASGRPTLAEIEHEVMCPTCHTLLELSHAPIADRMRAFIRRRIAAGDSDVEIKRRLVAEFGEGVLAVPPANGFGLVAWVLPAGGFIAVGALIGVTLRRWRQDHDLEQAPRSGEAAVQLDPQLARLLDRELAKHDD